jgi:hypothetical protein
MARRLFALAAVLSLTMFVATVVIWVRSYSRCDHVAASTPTNAEGRYNSVSFDSRTACVLISVERWWYAAGFVTWEDGWSFGRTSEPIDPASRAAFTQNNGVFGERGFMFMRDDQQSAMWGVRGWKLQCPHLLLALLFAPAWTIPLWRRMRRRARTAVRDSVGFEVRPPGERSSEHA